VHHFNPVTFLAKGDLQELPDRFLIGCDEREYADGAVSDAALDCHTFCIRTDEKSIGELLEITFRKEGHRVEVVHSVEAAKRKLESQIFDIIISDVRMPRESGVDLLKFAKEIAPGSSFC